MSEKKKKIITLTVAVILIVVSIVICSVSIISNSKLFEKPKDYGTTDKIELKDLGSAKELEGRIGIVTIFADDINTKWDFSLEQDKLSAQRVFDYYDIAFDWLKNQAAQYGKQTEFIYPASIDGDLIYRTSFNEYIPDVKKSFDRNTITEWKYIDKNIDSDKLKESYELDSVVYMFFFNYTEDNPNESMAYYVAYYNKPLAYEYEMVFVPIYHETSTFAPTVIAHEFLHCFGAPDWYFISDIYNTNYGTTIDTAMYAEENFPDDIMISTYVLDENGVKVRVFDSIPKTISPLTAYYLGWSDEEADTAQELGLVNSQHYPPFQKTEQ